MKIIHALLIMIISSVILAAIDSQNTIGTVDFVSNLIPKIASDNPDDFPLLTIRKDVWESNDAASTVESIMSGIGTAFQMITITITLIGVVASSWIKVPYLMFSTDYIIFNFISIISYLFLVTLNLACVWAIYAKITGKNET